jgi:hypothetical protein
VDVEEVEVGVDGTANENDDDGEEEVAEVVGVVVVGEEDEDEEEEEDEVDDISRTGDEEVGSVTEGIGDMEILEVEVWRSDNGDIDTSEDDDESREGEGDMETSGVDDTKEVETVNPFASRNLSASPSLTRMIFVSGFTT